MLEESSIRKISNQLNTSSRDIKNLRKKSKISKSKSLKSDSDLVIGLMISLLIIKTMMAYTSNFTLITLE